MTRIKLILVMFLLMSSACAETVPKLNGYVNDFAGILTPGEETLLKIEIEKIEKETTVEIALITVKNTGGMSLPQFATKAGDINGVGKSATDNGIIILWSESNERGGFIATGRGIESTLTDSTVSRIGRSSRSSFDSRNYYDGFTIIIDGVRKELNASKNKYSPNISESEEYTQIPSHILTIITVIVILAILVVILSALDSDSFGGGNGGSFRSSSYIGSSGFGGFSSSFGGFSGGSFGGGGGGF